MVDKMEMEEFIIRRKVFSPMTIRKVIFVDETYFYEYLAYVNPHTGDKRWSRILMTNHEIELEIEKYSENV